MKKTFILFIFFTIISGNAYSQVKKSSAKNNSTRAKKVVVKEEKTDEQLAMEKAQVWFKEKYVETTFKDPYSYRVVGIKAVKVTNGDYLDKMASDVKKHMDNFLETYTDEPEVFREKFKALIRECEESMEQYHDTSLYDSFKRERDKNKKILAKIEEYFTYKEEYESIIKLKNEASVEELNAFRFYDIHLDCYSKNDLGNEVLGRFVFPFTKDGVYVDDKTTFEKVKKIN